MTVRDEQVALTRRMIIDSFWELSTRPGAKPVTVAEVARHSGVSPATIYRHFPNRDALVMEASNIRNNVGQEGVQESWTIEDLRAHLRALWGDLAENIALTREAAVSEAGREMRAARWQVVRAEFEEFVRENGGDPASLEGQRFMAAANVLGSSYAFLDLFDRQGIAPEEAADLVCWAISQLAQSIGMDDEVIRVPGPSIPRPAGGETG